MLSKNKIKYIHSLEQKKNRKEEQAFIAEGPKLVGDLLGHFTCRLIVGTDEWLNQHPYIQASEIIVVKRDELSRISLQKTPQEVLAIFEQPPHKVEADAARHSLCLALDDVQDPGNVGTIARVADWFGIEHIFCSRGTADIYNPKTVQATMGAIARVKFHYCDLAAFITEQAKADVPLFGTFLNGNNVYEEALDSKGIIIMGNEGNGISPDIAEVINHRLFIPNYPPERATSESLNVAIATAIVCAEFRRRK